MAVISYTKSPTFRSTICLILILGTQFSSCSHNEEFLDPQCLKIITSSEFLTSVKTINYVHIPHLVSIFSPSPNGNAVMSNSHLSHANSLCHDLLELTFEPLNLTASAIQGRNYGTGHLSSDLSTWLSFARTNLMTCVEELVGTNATSVLKRHVSAQLSHVSSLILDLLAKVDQVPCKIETSKDDFPAWVRTEDPVLILGNRYIVPNVVVAMDGTGNYTSVVEAVSKAPDHSMKHYVIYVKKGLYKEYVAIDQNKWNLVLIGDGIGATIISGNRSNSQMGSTYRSATFGVDGQRFVARDITFENTAGPHMNQSVAVRSLSDLSGFYRCEIFGYQDTLYLYSNRQFYRECTIKGTVDFIFGDAAVVFQNCTILAKKGLPNQKNTITAHKRCNSTDPTGFSFQSCNVSADVDLIGSIGTIKTYLGRPWMPNARTIFMECYMSDVVSPEGWLEWNETSGLDTVYYGEYMNNGPGAVVDHRVKSPGVHIINDSAEANKFTVSQFIDGDMWLPGTGVPYDRGLRG